MSTIIIKLNKSTYLNGQVLSVINQTGFPSRVSNFLLSEIISMRIVIGYLFHRWTSNKFLPGKIFDKIKVIQFSTGRLNIATDGLMSFSTFPTTLKIHFTSKNLNQCIKFIHTFPEHRNQLISIFNPFLFWNDLFVNVRKNLIDFLCQLFSADNNVC